MAQEAVGSSPITHPRKVLKYQDKRNSGCSVARLARLLWEQEVEGSNPFTPTRQKPLLTDIKPFFIEGLLFYHIDSINVKDIQKRDTLLRDTTRVHPHGVPHFPHISTRIRLYALVLYTRRFFVYERDTHIIG